MSQLAPSPARSAYRLFDFGYTDTGLVRAANEDALVRRPEVGLWAVADGMGGHQDGAWSAQRLTACLAAARVGGDKRADRAAVAAAVEEANRQIQERARAAGARMGATVVVLLIGGGRYDVFWIGDSRCYLFRDGALTPLTTDHTAVQAKVDQGLISRGEARHHPMAHVLTRAVGTAARAQLDHVEGELLREDRFLLCSDGVHGVLAEAEIAEALATGDAARSGQALAGLCLARGAPDNLTLIGVDCRRAD